MVAFRLLAAARHAAELFTQPRRMLKLLVRAQAECTPLSGKTL